MVPGVLSPTARLSVASPPERVAALCRDCLTAWQGEAVGEGGRCPACGSRRILCHPELRSLAIAHIDCDSFYASIEKRDAPALKDKPLLIGGTGPRSVVSTACYLARRYGCRSAMPMYKARELCPQAVVLPPDHGKYRRVSVEIHNIFQHYTDLIQPVALDEAYLDLAHRDDIPEVLANIALRVEQEVGISVSIGLSYCKFLAKMASDLNKPRGFSVVGRQEALAFLAPQPVRAIHGVGPALERKLIEQGFATVADLQAASPLDLKARFGSMGRHLWHLAHGEDDRPVNTDREAKSISAETTYDVDQSDPEALLATLHALAERVETRLKRADLSASVVQIKLKTPDFRLLTRQAKLPDPTQRAGQLMRHAEPLLRREATGRAFRLVGLGVDGLGPSQAADPPDLFSL